MTGVTEFKHCKSIELWNWMMEIKDKYGYQRFGVNLVPMNGDLSKLLVSLFIFFFYFLLKSKVNTAQKSMQISFEWKVTVE